MKQQKRDLRLIIIFIQALIAMLGSLYYSNFGDPIAHTNVGEFFNSVNGLPPCNLCWWARIIMYPITLLSGIGLILNDRSILKYIAVLSIPGIALEIYHYMLQKIDITTSQACTFANPCDALKVDYLGFITIPFLCLTAFVVILLAATTKQK